VALRLHWNYPHLVARFQEVQLMLESGIEVVCALDELPNAEKDPAYHDEINPLYPRWRESLALASSVVERLRRFSPYRDRGKPPEDVQRLVNETVDLIYVGGEPKVVEGLGSWFTGSILYRVMGFPNFVGQTAVYRQLNEIVQAPSFRSRFILSPGYAGLAPNRLGALTARTATINGWVDRARAPHTWLAEESASHVTTAISYIHFHSYFQAQFREVGAAFSSYPLRVLGKNDAAALPFKDERIAGFLPFSQLYTEIAQSRAFVDAGSYPNHLIWPPVEAAVMGVPVLFVRTSGLVDPLRAGGYSLADMRGMGMFDSFADIQNFLLQHSRDIPLLREIAIRQKRALVDHVFGRENARRAVLKGLVEQEERYANPLRKDRPRRIMRTARRTEEPPVQQQLAPLFLDAGENRWFMPQQMRFLAGRVERRNNGRPTLMLQPGRDEAGQVIETYLPPVRAGWYIATLMVEVYEKLDAPALVVELGPWRDGAFQPEQRTLHSAVPGLAEFEFDLAVREREEEAQRELRVRWSGKAPMGVIGLRLDPAPYPDWLAPHQRP